MTTSPRSRAHWVLASAIKKVSFYLSWKRCECVHGEDNNTQTYIGLPSLFGCMEEKIKTTTKAPCFTFLWILGDLLCSLTICCSSPLQYWCIITSTYFFATKSCQIIMRIYYSKEGSFQKKMSTRHLKFIHPEQFLETFLFLGSSNCSKEAIGSVKWNSKGKTKSTWCFFTNFSPFSQKN